MFVLPQLVTKNLIIGSDAIFHFNRFYDTAMQIKNNNFEYFISRYGFQQSARIVNPFYGPLFSYFQGLLVLIGRSWFGYQVFSNVTILIISGFSMYILMRNFSIKKTISVYTAIIYMTTFSIQYWLMRQGFTSWGAAFFPICLLPICDMLQKKSFNKIQLGFFTALMMQIHLFSAFLLVCCYFPFFLYAYKETKDKLLLIKKIVSAILIFIVLTMNLWVSMYYLYCGDTIQNPFINSSMSSNTINSNSYYWIINPFYLVLIILFCICMLIKYFRRTETSLKIVIFTGTFFLVLSTSIIPWSYLLHKKIRLIELIQFPFRFFVPATILFLIAFALILNKFIWHKKLVRVILFILTLLSCVQAIALSFVTLSNWNSDKNFIQAQKHVYFFSESSKEIKRSFHDKELYKALLLVQKATPDYLPVYSKENKYFTYAKEIINNQDNFTKEVQDKELLVYWNGNDKELVVPVVLYKRTNIELNGKRVDKDKMKRTSIGALVVKSNMKYNTLKISYETPILLTYSNFIVLVGFSVTIIYLGYKYFFN